MRLSVNFTVNGIRWHAPAATIAGFALTTLTESSLAAITRAIAHLREVLGDQKYESLARAGQAMTTAAMAPTPSTKSSRPGRNSNEKPTLNSCLAAVCEE
jgi:hypothetical protein